ncbi:MAG: class I lanthipeptide [Candidatus Aminicenantes bacterium]|nr:class I lanthipeptide [Candidatus Aminicenantes bacterium]
MKKKIFAKKLALNKKTIAALDDSVLLTIKGGKTKVEFTCDTQRVCCPITTEEEE